MKMNKRLFLILSIWTTTIAWHIHFYPTWAGSPMPATYGVNIDWTRHHIVKTGHIGQTGEPWTLISSQMGTQNYDFGSIFMAIINILSGTNDLIESLTLLNAIQPAGLLLLPVPFLYWYHITDSSRARWTEIYFVLLLSYFATHTTISQSTEGWYTGLFATVTLIFIITFLYRSRTSRRVLSATLIMSFLMMNLYHTWVLLFIAFIGTIFVFGLSLYKSNSLDSFSYHPVGTIAVVIIFMLFFLSGVYINSRLSELVGGLSKSLYAPDQFGITTTADVAGPSVKESLFNYNSRRGFKLINMGAAFSIVLLYSLDRIKRVVSSIVSHTHGEPVFEYDTEHVLFPSLFAFPVFIAIFYRYQGIGSAVARTRYIGIYFVIFTFIILVQSNRRILRLAVIGLAVLMIVSALPAAALSGLSPSHNIEEQHSITYTGDHISRYSYVFSTSSLGPQLGYYNVKGISIITPRQENWENRLRIIYYQTKTPHAIAAVQTSIIKSKTSTKAPFPNQFYILLSSAPKKEGVGIRPGQTKPTGVDPRNKFNAHSQVAKIYSSGNNSLFYYST